MDALVVAVVLLAAWSVLLTVLVLRRRPERWEPVYRRLPDGRIRFAWSVAQSYESTRRARMECDSVPAGVRRPTGVVPGPGIPR